MIEARIAYTEIEKCSLDGSRDLATLWTLPKFPLTEAFGDYDCNFPTLDQALMICRDCGHIQLQHLIDPNFLYSVANYAFRTRITKKIKNEIEFFSQFINSLGFDTRIRNVVEIGASNFELAKQIGSNFHKYAVCDPLLAELDGTTQENIIVFGKLAENAITEFKNFESSLVLGRHILEHVLNPLDLLETILSVSDADCVFVFEVPSLRHLRKQYRFDAIYHQHCQYFDADSIKLLVSSLGCELLEMKFNPLGSNGGSVLFAFKKSKQVVAPITRLREDVALKSTKIVAEIELFKSQMECLREEILTSNEPVYGYGAAHMLASLNYHLHGAIENLQAIFDDNIDLHGKGYKNIKPIILHPTKVVIEQECSYLITSMENRRSIMVKLLGGKSRIFTTPII